METEKVEIHYFIWNPCKTCDYFETSVPTFGWPDLKFSINYVPHHLLKFRVVQNDKQRKIKRIEVALCANRINLILPTTNELCWSNNLFSPPCDTKEGQEQGYYFTRFGSFARNMIGSPDVYIWFEDGESKERENITLEVQTLL